MILEATQSSESVGRLTQAVDGGAGETAFPRGLTRRDPPRNLLRLYTDQEILQRGYGVLDRAQQFVYDAIQARSSVDSMSTVGRVDLFCPETAVLQTSLFQPGALPEILDELLKRRLILALPCFEFRPENGWLDVRGYLVARRDADESLVQIYETLSAISRKCIVEWLGQLKGVAEALRQDLESNLRPNLLPPLEHEATSGADAPGPRGRKSASASDATDGIPPDDLASWAASAEYTVLFDPLRALRNAQYTIAPGEAVLKYFAEDQRRELIETQAAVPINGLGFLPYHEDEILPCFEIARDFLESHVVPEYLNDHDIRREMDRIALEEALYEIEIARATTGRFAASRAAVLRRMAFSDAEARESPEASGAQDEDGLRAPGRLACEIVLRLANHAEQRYINEWKASARQFVEDFVEKLNAHGGDWRRMVRYVSHKQLANFHPDVWNLLRNHPALFYQPYELPDGTMHVFVVRDFQAFRLLLRGMLELPPPERWRIAALRSLIENYEHRFKLLFADETFVREYGRLLRKAYIDYMPLWARIFLFSGIGALRDYFFQRAKTRIKREQAFLARRNARLFDEFVKSEKAKRRKMVLGMRDTSCAQDLIGTLEKCYFELGIIPNVREVARMISGFDRADLIRVLKAANFKILRVDTDGDLLETGVLLFPRNGDYPDRMKRLIAAVDGLFLRLQEKFAAGLLDDRGREQLERARKLQVYLRREKNFVVR
ncbi:MAG: hypothetical protein RIF32_08000 [Leptospirales bacterium]|jgi:hypothetical protein